jgi:DNA-binding transcriptional MerR regulator
MRIGELSRRTRVSVRLLRYYEAQGLLDPSRTTSGYREYDTSAPQTVDQIRRLLRAGISTRAIAEILPCVRVEGETMTPTCPRSRAQIAAERDRVTAAIGDLNRARDLLDRILHAGR